LIESNQTIFVFFGGLSSESPLLWMCRSLNKDFLISELLLKLTLRLSCLCAVLVLPGCLVVIGPPAEHVSRALEASSAEEHSEAADEASEEAAQDSEKADQAAEEGGEDDAVSEN
jgi:hypothetical protein